MQTHWRRNLLFGVAVPALGYLLVHFTLLDRPRQSALEALGIDPATFDVDTISPSLAKQLGLRSQRPATEIVAVVISAEFCTANQVEGFHQAVSKIPSLLQAQVAGRPDVVTRTIGVALDNEPKAGVDYLFGLAEFDEVIAGGNWLNTATEKFLWGGHSLEASIPQVVLLERTVTWAGGSTAVLERERVLGTIVGAEEVMDWVSRGAPTATLASAPPIRSGTPLPGPRD